MIKKSYEIEGLNLEKYSYFLFYGENSALKNEIIDKHFKTKYINSTFRYEENEVLNDVEKFFEKIITKSFFEKQKLLIIDRSTDKIIKIIDEIIDRNIKDINIIFIADILDKKSKMRNFFEKHNSLVCIPFYQDTYKTFLYLIQNFFNQKNIKLSNEIINLIIERANGNRQSLKNELSKIENFLLTHKNVDLQKISKLVNISENNNISELVDFCLAKNEKKIHRILNENNFTNDDTVLIIRTFLNKTKRLIKLKNEMEKSSSIDNVISSYKPIIFWKDKDVVETQMKKWTTENIKNLLYSINEIEFLMKKNYENSLKILFNFIFSTVRTNN